MIHALSPRYLQEFSRSIEVVRLDMTRDGSSSSPVLLIKGVTLTLKFLIRLRTFRLLFWKLEPSGHLWYGVQIADDPARPGTLWSVAETEEEMAAVTSLLNGNTLSVFLFNEDGINVASASVQIVFAEPTASSPFEGIRTAPEGAWRQHEGSVDLLLVPGSSLKPVEANPASPCEWTEVSPILITSRLTPCKLEVITGDEGDQQETLAEWLVDTLGHPLAVRNPFAHERSRPRELSDLLLSYQFGCFLVESKTLAVFGRTHIPDRATLKKNVIKAVKKAVNQLTGACANIHRGVRITDHAGHDLELTRDQPIHCVVLVPDLSIIAECDEFGARMILPFMQKSKAFLHLIDPSELRRLVHNAGFIATNSQTLTPLMAFDAILLKRCEQAGTQQTPYFHFGMTLGNPTANT